MVGVTLESKHVPRIETPVPKAWRSRPRARLPTAMRLGRKRQSGADQRGGFYDVASHTVAAVTMRASSSARVGATEYLPVSTEK